MKNISVGKKIMIGFGVVLVLLAVVGVLSFTGAFPSSHSTPNPSPFLFPFTEEEG